MRSAIPVRGRIELHPVGGSTASPKECARRRVALRQILGVHVDDARGLLSRVLSTRDLAYKLDVQMLPLHVVHLRGVTIRRLGWA